MLEYVEKVGKTVEAAIEEALQELNIEEKDAEIQIIDEGSKGLFGLIGGRNAVVRVWRKIDYNKIVRDFLEPVFIALGIEGDLDVTVGEDSINVKVNAEDTGILIGRRGETLDALQYLLGLVVNKSSGKFIRVIFDVGNYREKREETLEKLARKLASRVVKSKKSITLEPMNPYERRIIHSTLQNYRNVETYSIGDEPNRKVVIRYKREPKQV
ncbi:RNA-binding cell elongation regulator Jag/EloR [Thermoclostridium stercorarium]|uniref:RNA-binding cell elongation regulator Jag/EloR n=1 Tax=Thermoclostridium stercorarium TaxID=1510 RepID=UPI0009F2D29F|nr:RNA-binding cell elongation regulator Jag/EloR [Thermoclostridium stercorarium]